MMSVSSLLKRLRKLAQFGRNRTTKISTGSTCDHTKAIAVMLPSASGEASRETSTLPTIVNSTDVTKDGIIAVETSFIVGPPASTVSMLSVPGVVVGAIRSYVSRGPVKNSCYDSPHKT